MTDEDRVGDLLIEWDDARALGRELTPEELCHDCPALVEDVRQGISELKVTDWMFDADDENDTCLSVPPTLVAYEEDHVSSPVTFDEFTEGIVATGLMHETEVAAIVEECFQNSTPRNALAFAQVLVRQEKLTQYQATRLLAGASDRLVLGDYVILDKLGAGGMGEVFKARHRHMDRLVAIKILPAWLVKSKDAVRRFTRETQMAAKLEHPNIVLAFDAGSVDDTHFLVMQFIEGQDLFSRVQWRGPLRVAQAVDFMIQAARGLVYAHEQGVVHRDIKPSNLLVDTHGTVKILDLGLARLRERSDQQDADEPLTRDGTVMGTVDYMAPEQALDSRHADVRADVYGLGCTLYFLLTENPLFTGETMLKSMLAHREQPVPSLRARVAEVSEQLDATFRKMVAKSADDRFQSMSEVVAALERCRLPNHPAENGQAVEHEVATTVSIQAVTQDTTPLSAGPAASDASTTKDVESRGRRRANRTWVLLAAGLVSLSALAGVIIIKITNKDGTSREIVVDGDLGEVEKIEISTRDETPASKTEVKQAKAKQPETNAQREQLRPDDAAAPFDAKQAAAHQKAWAKFLDVPVETTNSIGMRFRLIPPGTFRMGTTPEDAKALLDEFGQQRPRSALAEFATTLDKEVGRHRVTLTVPFYISVHEVTQQQYATVMGENPSAFSRSGRLAGKIDAANTDELPVESVNWHDAASFCQQLSSKENKTPSYLLHRNMSGKRLGKGTGYRLPTEAEWEFACRAGTGTRYWSGDDAQSLHQIAWMMETSDGRTHPVGRLPANPFGLHDTYGNVAEWCEDSMRSYSTNSARNPKGKIVASRKVLRGGGRRSHALACRSAKRGTKNHPYPGSAESGFRVVLPLNGVLRE